MSGTSDRNLLTVTELTARIKQMLEQGFSRIELCGEVSRLTRPASGHLYFTIKDAHAAISAVVWRSTAQRLAVKPEEGGEFIFSGHLSLYEPRGSYQLVVTRVEAAGSGALAAEFERRKQQFAALGWFDRDAKQPIPSHPKRIGIVTSATAAAFEDVKKVLATRPGWIDLTLSPCLVQGNGGAVTIAQAIRRLQQQPETPDLILLVRGGGSIEDLWCFNDEAVVKAVVECPIPIISGIGHEIDTTLADLAADLRAATPSNAAELSSPSRQELSERLPRITRLHSLMSQRLGRQRHELITLKRRSWHALERQRDQRYHASERQFNRLLQLGQQQIGRGRAPLRQLERRLQPLQPATRLRQQRQQCQRLNLSGEHALAAMLKQRRSSHTAISDRLHAERQQFTGMRHRLEVLTSRLIDLDPHAVLKRGYSISYDESGRLISSAAMLEKGCQFTTRFHDGAVTSRVIDQQPITEE